MSVFNSVTSVFTPIHRDGWKFVAIFAAVTLVLFWLGVGFLGWIGVVLTAWCAYFFRDPERVTPLRAGLVISPADGRVSAIERVVPPPELELPREPLTRISVFMNVFDVHVNRTPVAGTITGHAYHHGTFLNASFDKASDENERRSWRVRASGGREIGLVQIAGLVARRIVCWAETGGSIAIGERFGLIRFGSRVDVFLPSTAVPRVAVGQTAVGGETVLAEFGGIAATPLVRIS
jgi:phosphatidylserine decarboxylase